MELQIAAKISISFAFIVLTSCGGSSGGGEESPAPVDHVVQTPVRPAECIISNRPVINPKAPRLTLQGPSVIHVPIGGTYIDEGASATDDEDGDLTNSIVTTGADKVNTAKTADYLIRYNATDKDGHAAKELHRVVRVHSDGTLVKYSMRPFNSTSAPAGFLEHLPTFYGDDPKQLYPLIIYAHGWEHFVEQSPESDRLSTLLKGANIYKVFDDGLWPNSRPFIALEPQRCLSDNIGDGEWALVDQFIDWAIATYPVDTNRIYMTGLSAGGYFTYRYPVLYPNRLAAIVPMSAGGPVSNAEQVDSFCKAMATMPIWAFHGDNDATVPLLDSTYTFEVLRYKCPKVATPAPLLTIIPGGSHVIANEIWNDSIIGSQRSDSNTYSISIYDWFLQYSLNK